MLVEHMIEGGEIVPARYALMDEVPQDFEGAPDTAIPMDDWLRLHARGAHLEGTGVIVPPNAELRSLRAHLDEVPFVAVHFPKFTDGRGYTHARRLREMWGYEGTILAYGDVLRDQIVHMARCGVDAFYMAPGSDLHAALNAFQTFSRFYQYCEDTVSVVGQ
ncbi:MAG: DUF934 domain-containing protein [Myxococcota bacterium]